MGGQPTYSHQVSQVWRRSIKRPQRSAGTNTHTNKRCSNYSMMMMMMMILVELICGTFTAYENKVNGTSAIYRVLGWVCDTSAIYNTYHNCVNGTSISVFTFDFSALVTPWIQQNLFYFSTYISFLKMYTRHDALENWHPNRTNG